MDRTTISRLVIFIAVAGLHGILIFFAAFSLNTPVKAAEPTAQVMKLVDIREEIPPPPPPPPPPPERPREIPQNAVEAIAETMIETDEVPEETVVVTEILPAPAAAVTVEPSREIEYLPMHQISTLPSFSEREIRNALVYPPIALRSGIEGIVYLELFVDSQGAVRQVTLLREEPPGRGFGEAAIKAFTGLRGTPAQANGRDVAARYRYPVRFTIR